MSPRRPAAVRPARRRPSTLDRPTGLPTSAWVQPITYVLAVASLGAAALAKDLVMTLAAALHLT